jgi:hypothetical protein
MQPRSQTFKPSTDPRFVKKVRDVVLCRRRSVRSCSASTRKPHGRARDRDGGVGFHRRRHQVDLCLFRDGGTRSSGSWRRPRPTARTRAPMTANLDASRRSPCAPVRIGSTPLPLHGHRSSTWAAFDSVLIVHRHPHCAINSDDRQLRLNGFEEFHPRLSRVEQQALGAELAFEQDDLEAAPGAQPGISARSRSGTPRRRTERIKRNGRRGNTAPTKPPSSVSYADGFFNRTPSPPPSLSMNSMPASSSARRIARSFGAVSEVAASVSSARRIVVSPTDDERARSSALHRRRARAARICALVSAGRKEVDFFILYDTFNSIRTY